MKYGGHFVGGLWLLLGTTLWGQSFVDEFDFGDINDRWLIQKNAVGSTEMAQEDGHGVVTSTGANANGGLASVASFNPLADGIYVSFVISEIVGAPNANGFLVGVVDDNTVFHRNTNNFGIAAFGQEARTFSSDGFSLIVGDQNGSNESDIILDEGQAVDMDSFQDGFTVALSADEAGWAYVIEGLADVDGTEQVFENTGTWADAGTTFAEVFGQDDAWHVLTANQSPGEKITRFDRIALGDPKPASDPDVRVTSRLSLGQLPSFPQVQESTLTIRNAGESQELTITGVEVGGPDGEHFQVPADQLPLVIAPDASGELTFQIDNLGETGGFLGALTLLTNDPAPEEDGRVMVEVTASVIDLQGPRAHYRFDETEGTEMRDVTGFDRHGVYGEEVVLGVDGLFEGSAMEVADGASATVAGRLFDEGTFEEFSLSLWFQANQLGGLGTLVANGNLGESPAFALLVVEGELSWFVEEAVEFAAGGVSADSVHHAVVTYDADLAVIYLDGVEVARREAPAAFDIDPMASLHVGAFGALGFNGVIDDLRIFQRVLTAEDVGELFDPSDMGPDVPTDSDGDGLSDEEEVNDHQTDPLVADTDGDGLSDGVEVDGGSDPLQLDTDGGGTWDGFEVAKGTDPTVPEDDPAVWTVWTARARSQLTTVGDVDALFAEQEGNMGAMVFSEEWLRQHERINFLGTGGSGNFEDDLPFDNLEAIEAADLNDFVVVATTEIFIETAGRYTFGFNSDDGGRLSVNGNPVAFFNGTRGAGDSLGATFLAPGFHEVEVLYFERGGGSELEVYWDPESGDSSAGFDPGRHVLLEPSSVRRDDGDGDGLADAWEQAVFGDLAKDGSGDADGDGLSDKDEHDAQTDPQGKDSDGDGLEDGPEVNEHGTSPLVVDTDGDRLSDGDEIHGAIPSDPTNADTDGDGFRDGFEVSQGSSPADAGSVPKDPLGEPDESWHVLEALPTFNGFRGSDDTKDVTFRLFVDFEATDATEDEREMLWESGGGTVGFSLVYETGNRLVLRGVGDGGNTIATVEHVLTADQLGAGELSVIWTFDVDNGDPETGQTIALYLENQKVGEDRKAMDADWTGSNAAAFGVGSNAFAAGGGNTSLTNGVDFRSGTIDLDSGLQFFADRFFDPDGGGGPVDPEPASELVVLGIEKRGGAIQLQLGGDAGAAFVVEYSENLEAGSWSEIVADVIAGDGTAAVEDADPERQERVSGYYRVSPAGQ